MSLALLVAVVEDVGVDVTLQSGQLGEDEGSQERVARHHYGGATWDRGRGRGGLCWSRQETEDEAGEKDEDGLGKYISILGSGKGGVTHRQLHGECLG